MISRSKRLVRCEPREDRRRQPQRPDQAREGNQREERRAERQPCHQRLPRIALQLVDLPDQRDAADHQAEQQQRADLARPCLVTLPGDEHEDRTQAGQQQIAGEFRPGRNLFPVGCDHRHHAQPDRQRAHARQRPQPDRPAMLGLPGADTRDRAVVDQAGVTPPLQVVLGDHQGILRNGWKATSRARQRGDRANLFVACPLRVKRVGFVMSAVCPV